MEILESESAPDKLGDVSFSEDLHQFALGVGGRGSIRRRRCGHLGPTLRVGLESLFDVRPNEEKRR